jgi:hypothetical protein
MCLSSNTPAPPPIKKPPMREDAARSSALDARRRGAAKQDNIFTSALGDVTYGSNVKKSAALGGSGRADAVPA